MNKIRNFSIFNDAIIIFKSSNLGGTGIVINSLTKIFNLTPYFINLSNLKFLLNDPRVLICIQPTALFAGIILFLLGKKNIFFIVDSDPRSFNFLKCYLYLLIIFILYIFINNDKILTPNGQLSKNFPFKNFNIIDWFDFVEPKFCEYKWDIKNKNISFLFYGNLSNKKGFNNFIQLFNHNFFTLNYSVSAFGYLNNKSNHYSHLVLEKLNSNINNYLLIWCSIFESYGFVFREFCCSGVPVIFCRHKLYNDNINNSIYISNVTIDENLTNLFMFIIKNHKQVYDKKIN